MKVAWEEKVGERLSRVFPLKKHCLHNIFSQLILSCYFMSMPLALKCQMRARECSNKESLYHALTNIMAKSGYLQAYDIIFGYFHFFRNIRVFIFQFFVNLLLQMFSKGSSQVTNS